MEKNRKLYIIYERYYDFENKRILSGGIQTYLKNLIPLFIENGFECILYQAGKTDEFLKMDEVVVHNVDVDLNKGYDRGAKRIFNKFKNDFRDGIDFLLFATECFSFNNSFKNTIAIQHGICWDIPTHTNFSKKMNNLFAFRKVKNTYSFVNKASRANTVVCVDYNYVNWFRASTAYQSIDFKVIPNFTEIAPLYKKNENPINIIFARRLEKYRGTEVFLKAIIKILNEFEFVNVTIAGRGPEKEKLMKSLEPYGDKVAFLEYDSNQSLGIHSNQNIAVIPTVGSEGTSLSLLEAMSAQCAVVCSNVGGMTNIVLDGFNGLMVSANNSNELYKAIKLLILDSELRNKIARNAYETVKEAFSKEKWEDSWRIVIKQLIN